jgi:hypothetical protein
MAITAAAEKTTAAFFIGFPFTKIVVDKGDILRTGTSASLCANGTKALCRLNPAPLCVELRTRAQKTQAENLFQPNTKS